MRQYARTRGFLAAASIVAIGFVTPAALSPLSYEVLAQSKTTAAPKPTITTSSDNTYGEGGSLTSASDAAFKLTGEQFKDKNGVVRETRTYGPDGSSIVLLYDETGKSAGSYSVAKDRSGGWTLVVTLSSAATYTEMMTYDAAVKQGMEWSKHFAMTGEFLPNTAANPPVQTKVEAPNLLPNGSSYPDYGKQPEAKEADTKTKVEMNLSPNGSAYPDFGKQPEAKPEPKAATNIGTQGAAPKTCGEIRDQETLLAMGCISRPGTPTTVSAPRGSAPVLTPAANRAPTDCLSDPICADNFKTQELLRERERASGVGKGEPDYPRLDLPVPGGIPVFPGR